MILMNDFKAEPPELQQAMLEAAKRVIESGWFVLGKEVSAFEQQWALACGLAFGVGVGNGMDAIEIALRALEVGPGDEVITTPMTAFATVLAIIRAGATPVFADIDPQTALLSLESARRCVTSRTKAVVLVHLYGQIRAMDLWNLFCANYEIALIEDCAQAHLASLGGKAAGSFGVMGAYSFYPTKNLGAIGDAGMIVTNVEKLAVRASQLRNYGQSVRYQHPELGLNSRLDEIQAAILAERLKWLPDFTERRRQIATAYFDGIKNSNVTCLALPESGSGHVYHLFVITCPCRDELQAHLQKNQIQTFIHYPIPIHMQEPCRNLCHDPLGLVNSERHADTCLSLPCHPQMSDEDIAAVIAAVNSFQGK
ncbi:DegT/DnrJ/EryC1/StrS family aminotransferase [Methylomonas sp. EFPC1]|uniref:DegT/DnrJ/EryC1/StrS family aminotransferase n=1 Tax=Methylomonas sp. EFPC1 TaxID=2812647 RepID=UPI001967E5A6|nr:DegT/DnrJ/EryC1/StrS family aminotransferase [Methylomonas sp. EFPC1]QSA99625.1 DegT/DnrJ/EryC1/StrS family aminotransferase [Methylomonas sp. EFPC1]